MVAGNVLHKSSSSSKVICRCAVTCTHLSKNTSLCSHTTDVGSRAQHIHNSGNLPAGVLMWTQRLVYISDAASRLQYQKLSKPNITAKFENKAKVTPLKEPAQTYLKSIYLQKIWLLTSLQVYLSYQPVLIPIKCMTFLQISLVFVCVLLRYVNESCYGKHFAQKPMLRTWRKACLVSTYQSAAGIDSPPTCSA